MKPTLLLSQSRGLVGTRRLWLVGLLVGFWVLPSARIPALSQPPEPAKDSPGSNPRPGSVRIVPRPPRTLDVDLWTDQSRYRVGDDVRVYFRVERDARVYLFNTDAAGQTHQIFPNGYDRDNWLRGGVTFSVPDTNYRLVATGPTGWESLHLVAYASPRIYLHDYQEFKDLDDPFPLRPQGAEPLLQRLRSTQESTDEIPPQPETTAPTPSDRETGRIRPGAVAGEKDRPPSGPGTAEHPVVGSLRPIPPGPADYGEAKIFIYVGLEPQPYYLEPPDYPYPPPYWDYWNPCPRPIYPYYPHYPYSPIRPIRPIHPVVPPPDHEDRDRNPDQGRDRGPHRPDSGLPSFPSQNPFPPPPPSWQPHFSQPVPGDKN